MCAYQGFEDFNPVLHSTTLVRTSLVRYSTAEHLRFRTYHIVHAICNWQFQCTYASDVGSGALENRIKPASSCKGGEGVKKAHNFVYIVLYGRPHSNHNAGNNAAFCQMNCVSINACDRFLFRPQTNAGGDAGLAGW